MTPRKTGHLPDHPAVVARRASMHLHAAFGLMMAATSALPMATSNRRMMPAVKGGPGILDQMDTSACEGHANGSGGTLFLALGGLSKGLISPTSLYLGALIIDRTVNPDGTLSTVFDSGTMPSSIQGAWQTFGARLAAGDPQFPAHSSTLYQTPSNPNSPLILPTIDGGLRADSPYRYKGSYFINAQGPARVLQALATLASGRPISNAIPASGSQFQEYKGGILGALSGPIDHANLIVDYEWMGSSSDWAAFLSALQQGATTTVNSLGKYLILICVNSWGYAWGESDTVSTMAGGMYRANIQYFNQCEDACVLDLQAA